MNLKLEAIVVPVSDVDRAKKFYQEALGFRVDVDHRAQPTRRRWASGTAAKRAIASSSLRRRDRNARFRSARESRG
jgi:catechol 2,3-dioxygenase-like lactoylglutathione lyase family enzyme